MEIVAWEDSDTGTWRIVVHNYENGETSDFNPGDQSYGVNTYNNRCLIVKENGGSYDVRFVGPNGVDTFNIIGDYYTSESNDPYDND